MFGEGIWSSRRSVGVICGFLLASGFVGTAGLAQVSTNITSSGLNTQVSAPSTLPSGQVQHDITGGTRAGTNLFHSFGNFNVASNHIANFLNNTNQNTTNILGRVNGGNPSLIFGTLQTTGFGNANLFLMNPSGIVFGPNASLNVGGSVHFSTADYLSLDDGNRFNAVSGPADAVLTSAPVAAFGFTSSNPAALAVQGSQLTVEKGQTISLVGGQGGFTDTGTGVTAPNGVSITDNSRLIASEGQINVVSVGRPDSSAGGTVNLKGNEDRAAHTPSGFKDLGDVTISGGNGIPFNTNFTNLDVSGNSGGKILIRGGKLTFRNPAIYADTYGSGIGRGIVIDGTEVDISNDLSFTFDVIRIGSDASYFRNGLPGPLTITGTKSVTLNRALLGGNGDDLVNPTGNIVIKSPTISITNQSALKFAGGVPGAGQLDLVGKDITVAQSRITGILDQSPKQFRINATGNVVLDQVGMGLFMSGIGSKGSSINIAGRNIQIGDSTFSTGNPTGTGDSGAGPISLTAQNKVVIDNSEFNTSFDFLDFSRMAKGGPGVISVSGKKISIARSHLSSNLVTTDTTLPGGAINLTGNDISLTDSQLRSVVDLEVPGTSTGTIKIIAGMTFTSVNSSLDVSGGFEFGKGGEINIQAGKLLSLNDTKLLALGSSSGMSSGGTIKLNSGKDINISGGVDSLGRPLTALDVSGNAGGSITIHGDNITLENARIVSDTDSEDGGDVVIAGKTVDISMPGLSQAQFESLRIGTRTFGFGGGAPGTLSITGEKSVNINEARIGSRTDGFAAFPSGPILINAPKVDVTGVRFVLGSWVNTPPAQLTLLGRMVNLSQSLLGQTENFNPIAVRIAATGLASLDRVTMNLFSGVNGGSSIDISGRNIRVSRSNLVTVNPNMSLAGTGPITLKATNNVLVESTNVSTAFQSDAGDPNQAFGGPGPITIEGKNITLRDSTLRSTLSSDVPGQPTGAIHIQALQQLTSENTSYNVSGAFAGGGGEINIQAGKEISLSESTLLAESSSVSPAGTIRLESGKTVRISDSTLSVQNHGSGDAGFINIQAGLHQQNNSPNPPNQDGPNGDLGPAPNADQPIIVGQPPRGDDDQHSGTGGPLLKVGTIDIQQSVLNAQSQGSGQDGQIVLEAGKRIRQTDTTITPDPIVIIGGSNQ